MLNVSAEDITEGSIPRVLLVLAAPLVVQNVVFVLQELIDTFWLGRLGSQAVAAVGLNFPIISVIGALLAAPFIGGQIIAAQRFGREDRNGAQRAIFHALTLAGFFGVSLTILVLLGADMFIAALNPGPTVGPLAVTYLVTFALGLAFEGAGGAIESGFIAAGDTRAVLYANIAAVATNIVLDPLLILGVGPFPALGVRGAALATAASMVIGFLVVLALVLGPRDSVSLGWEAVAFEPRQYYEILDIGLPSSGQQFASQSVRVVIVGLVATVGGAAGLAAYTVGARVAALAFVPAGGLQQAAQSVVGQNLGAGNDSRATQTTWTGVLLAGSFLGVLGAVQYLFPTAIISVIVPEISQAGFELSVEYLRILAYGYWAIGGTYMFLAGFNAARRTRTSLVVDVVKYWGVRLPVAVLALPVTVTWSLLGITVTPGLGLGMTGIFWAVTGSNILVAVGVGAYYHYLTLNGMNERAVERAAASAGD